MTYIKVLTHQPERFNNASLTEYNEMVQALSKPPTDIIKQMTPIRANLMHAFIGIADELGEVAEVVSEDDIDKMHLVEELGDLIFYNQMLGMELGVDIHDFTDMYAQFTLPNVNKFSCITKLVNEAVTYAKRIGIYCKAYDNSTLVNYYIAVNMFVKHLILTFDLSFENIYQDNMDKLLGKRYASGQYSNEQANDRADKSESE